MAIEKQINPNSLNIEKNNAEVEVEVLNPEAVSISTEEEGMIIDFGQGEEEGEEVRDHNENIAEFLEEGELDKLGQELVNDFNSDRQSRSDWARAYVKGLDLLGLKIEERTQPWAGASGSSYKISSTCYGRDISTIRPSKN